MAKYLFIQMLQSKPIDLGSDGKGRQVFRFKILARKTPSLTFLEELVKLLTTSGAGPFGNPPLPFTYGSNVFTSNAVSLPIGEGPYVHIVDTGGPGPLRTHNDVRPSYEQPTADVTVYAKSSTNARAAAIAAYDAFSAVCNTVVTP